MKKYLMIPLLASLLLCTGCGKKLECSMEEGGMKMTTITEFDSKDKAKNVKVVLEMDMKELYDMDEKQTKEAVKEYKETYEGKKEYEGAKVTSKGTVITIEYSEEADDEDEGTSYEDVKKEAEELGMKCNK